MATPTTLKLPEPLKSRIAPLARAAGKTPHAWMLEALETQTTLSEKRATFVAEALASEQEVLQSGAVYAADSVHQYLRERVQGKQSPRPQPIKR